MPREPRTLTQLPPLSSDLIDLLDTVYPPRTPRPTDDLATVMFRAGARALVETLIRLRDSASDVETAMGLKD